MNKYLLDTNVVSEFRKRKPHGAVVQWMGELRNEQISISTVTLGELQYGAELTRRQDPQKAAEIDSWIDQLVDSYQLLPMDHLCFREWGRLMYGQSDDRIEDAMIAATAHIHKLTVATRNENDFRRFAIEVFNPFKPRT